MDALLANAIHDLKNNLHALNSQLGDAARQAPSPALAEARAISAHINNQLVQLLTLFRSAEGSLRLVVDDHDLANFIDELRLEPVGGESAGIAIEYHCEAAEDLGSWAFDAYQTKLVLADAVRNAVRHARSQIDFSLESVPGGGIAFVVRDDGPGFPAHILQGDEATMSARGSGLGLRFARLVASEHRTPDGRVGSLQLDNTSAEGGGRVRLYLP
jgi:signal transduction histidine kinase